MSATGRMHLRIKHRLPARGEMASPGRRMTPDTSPLLSSTSDDRPTTGALIGVEISDANAPTARSAGRAAVGRLPGADDGPKSGTKHTSEAEGGLTEEPDETTLPSWSTLMFMSPSTTSSPFTSWRA